MRRGEEKREIFIGDQPAGKAEEFSVLSAFLSRCRSASSDWPAGREKKTVALFVTALASPDARDMRTFYGDASRRWSGSKFTVVSRLLRAEIRFVVGQLTRAGAERGDL